MKKIRNNSFFKEFVILFGFFNGVWTALGVNPESKIFEGLKGLTDLVHPGNTYSIIFTYLPIILMVGTLIAIYFLGGFLGLIAVGVGFIGGMLILFSSILAVILLGVAFVLGFFAQLKQKKKK